MAKSLNELFGRASNNPGNPSPLEWRSVEARLGFELPKDYKDFVGAYGDVCINGFIYFMNPFSNNDALNLFVQSKSRIQALEDLVLHYAAELPYDLETIRHCFCPWAFTDNGDVFYWMIDKSLTIDRLVVSDDRAASWSEYKMLTTDLIRALLEGELEIPFLPDDAFSDGPQLDTL